MRNGLARKYQQEPDSVLIYYNQIAHISLLIHPWTPEPRRPLAALPDSKALQEPSVASANQLMGRKAGLQLPKCVCSQSTAFMKLSDSTSTSDSAWVLLG